MEEHSPSLVGIVTVMLDGTHAFTAWERDFLASVLHTVSHQWSLSPKQRGKVAQIVAKYDSAADAAERLGQQRFSF